MNLLIRFAAMLVAGYVVLARLIGDPIPPA